MFFFISTCSRTWWGNCNVSWMMVRRVTRCSHVVVSVAIRTQRRGDTMTKRSHDNANSSAICWQQRAATVSTNSMTVGCSVVCHTPWCQKTLGHSHFHQPPQEQTVLFSKIIQHCTQCTQLSSEIMATLWFLRHNLSSIKTGSSRWRFEEYRQFPFLYGNLAFSSPFGGKTRRKLCKSGD